MKQLLLIEHGIDNKNALFALLDTHGPEDVYTLFCPDKTTSDKERAGVAALLDDVGVLDANRLEIPISAIVQKTWRIMKHYAEHETAPLPHTENRKAGQKQLTEVNRDRLEALKTQIRHLVANDQAKRLQASLVTV